MTEFEKGFMVRALELANRGAGVVSPNPLVGALVVRDGVIVGEGYHRFDLLRHAESYALEMAGDQARGATLYCNLEPCSHQGRTPPCTRSVIEAGISRAVIGIIDPDPRVNGLGVAQLRQAGIEVIVGVLEEESTRINEIYLKNVMQGTPFIHSIEAERDLRDEEFAEWSPSAELLQEATRYDSLALGESNALNELFLKSFLNRHWHRQPILIAESAGSADEILTRYGLTGLPDVTVSNIQHVISGDSEITSIFALPGSALESRIGPDKLTIISTAVKQKGQTGLQDFVSVIESGSLTEVTGYRASRP